MAMDMDMEMVLLVSEDWLQLEDGRGNASGHDSFERGSFSNGRGYALEFYSGKGRILGRCFGHGAGRGAGGGSGNGYGAI
jgi:hypothetical protein